MRGMIMVLAALLTTLGIGLSGLADTPAAPGAPGAPAAKSAKASNDPLTAQEIRKLVDSGQYRDALKALTRVLQFKGKAAGDYDHHEMVMLRAECLLQIREIVPAINTLEDEVKQAIKDDSVDAKAEANAMILLIKKSPGQVYTPRTTSIRKPINILDRSRRKDAYLALFTDEFSSFMVKVKEAMLTPNLTPTVEAAKAAGELRDIERVATGSNQQTKDVMNQLADHAQKIVDTILDDLTARVSRISESANRLITDNLQDTSGHYFQVTHRRGLVGNESLILTEVIKNCADIPPGCELLAKSLGTHEDAFHTEAIKADNLKHQADLLLHDDYRTPVQPG